MNDTLAIEQDAIHLRRKVTELMEAADTRGYQGVDLSNVDFVSRSAADEFIHQSDQLDIQLRGMNGDVASIIEAISNQSRATPA